MSADEYDLVAMADRVFCKLDSWRDANKTKIGRLNGLRHLDVAQVFALLTESAALMNELESNDLIAKDPFKRLLRVSRDCGSALVLHPKAAIEFLEQHVQVAEDLLLDEPQRAPALFLSRFNRKRRSFLGIAAFATHEAYKFSVLIGQSFLS